MKIPADNTEMEYFAFGKGKKKFVIIPGLSVHSLMGLKDIVAEAYKAFAEDYTGYLIDRPKEPKEGITIRELAAETAAAMKNLDIDNAYIFGASQGGMIAQYIAIDHPELVKKLVLGSTLSKPNDTFLRTAEKWIGLAEQRAERPLIESFIDEVYSENTLKNCRDMFISANLGITEAEYQRFINLAKSCLSFNCYDELPKIKCPVLVLGSYGDRIVTAAGSEEIAAALKCELYLYDDSYGHGVYAEAHDYRDRCLKFFNK